MNHRKKAIVFWVLVLLLFFPGSSFLTAKEKMDPKEVIAKHLQSLGSPEKLAARKTCLAEGTGLMRILTGGSGSLQGPAVLASEGPRGRFNIQFDYTDYPSEQYIFSKETFEAGAIKPGRRSRLGQFLTAYDQIVKEGLLGGVLTTAWALTDLEKRNAKVQYSGLKKFDGKEAHEIKYLMKKGSSDMTVLLYFEPETFRHVATTYKIFIAAQIGPGGPNTSSSQTETRYELEERFDTFKVVEGFTLPFHWQIHLTFATARGTSLNEWDMSYDKISINVPIDSKPWALAP